ncbi:TonB-dependent siderophore receptor [Palleronia sp. LCG004]|uniref:TonB-dependent siderophore receptor n=1 Tax=Palleronia sp. LCG004 TaxID=3079304 RepID=UPI002943AD5D|nr:TonB-dependent siderophore receptor [Palleronia sp. LCG004]WOI57986.1 TonB-dependent siderophore receptor [Palleronia sp. LCG004]
MPCHLLPARPILLSGVLLLSASPLAMAQGADDGFLGTIVLNSQEDATGPVGELANPLTVTGSKFPMNVNEVPQSLSVLGTEQIEVFNAERVSEAMRYVPGVTSDVFGNDADYDWLRIRGFQADQTGIYLDNAQNLSFAFGSFFIDPYTLERVEVLRGPSSALYGGSNPGGIVNYVSKRPGERVRELSFGIDDAVSGSVKFDWGNVLTNGHSYRLTGRLKGGEAYDEFNDGLRGTFAPSYGFTLDTGTEVTLLANLHAGDEQHNGSSFLPYFGTVEAVQDFGRIDDEANFSDPDWDDYRRRQASVTGIVEHEFANGFTFTGVGRLGVASVEESYYYPFGYSGFALTPQDDAGTLSLVAFEHDTLVRTAQTDLRYYGTVYTGDVQHDLLVGLDARYYGIDEMQASGSGTTSVVGSVDPGTPTLGAPYQDSTTRQRQVGLYLQDQLRFGDGFIATANLRHDRVETEQDGAAGFAREDSETSYRVALAYETASGVTPYASYATFFNPLITSPGNGVTEPETGDQVEIGVKWLPEGGNFTLSAAAFSIERENTVTGVFPDFSQLGAVESKGVEVEGTYRTDIGLSVAGTFTYLDAEVTEDANATLVGTTPTLIPEREASLRAEYAFEGTLDGLTLGAGIRYRGESFASEDNALKVPSNTLVDLHAGYDFADEWHASLAVTNLEDERHVTGCQTAYVCSYGAGREVSFELSRRW